MSVTETPVIAPPVTRRDVLHRAADLLEEFGWCQWAPARNEDEWSVKPCDPDARSFCLTGSVERAVFDLFDGWNIRERGYPPSLHFSQKATRPGQKPWGDPDWNNAPERTRAEVVARLREAAEATT